VFQDCDTLPPAAGPRTRPATRWNPYAADDPGRSRFGRARQPVPARRRQTV